MHTRHWPGAATGDRLFKSAGGLEGGAGVRGVGGDQSDADHLEAVVVAGPGVRAFHERADPHGDVSGAAGHPGREVAQGGGHRAELVDNGLVDW